MATASLRLVNRAANVALRVPTRAPVFAASPTRIPARTLRSLTPCQATAAGESHPPTHRRPCTLAHLPPSFLLGTEPSTSGRTTETPSWAIKMLYDGDCPLCMREVDMLRRRDAGQGRICFVDVAAPDYSPADNADISFEAAMERIHAVLPDGTVVKNVEVFRRLYEQVGLGWVYAITKIPGLEAAANALYEVWAKYRLPITGRPDLAQVLAAKKTCADVKAEGSS